MAYEVNSRMENIGARRLHTIMEKLLSEVSFNAPDLKGRPLESTQALMSERHPDQSIIRMRIWSRYIL